MPNGDTCIHHTDLAVQLGRHETQLLALAKSVERIEAAVSVIQRTLWRWGGAIALLVFLLSVFGDRIARGIFGTDP